MANGRDNPNNSRDYDYPAMTFDGHGNVLNGPFDTDRTHQIKLRGLYLFKFGTSVGMNAYLESGTPITRQVPIIFNHNYPLRYLGRASDGRTPFFSQADLFAAHAAITARGSAKRERSSSTSLGIVGMRERVLQLGGQLAIRGAPGKGTTVNVRIPGSRC